MGELLKDKIITDEADAVSVAVSGVTTIATIRNPSKTLLCFHFNVVTNALDDFNVKIKAHPSATAEDITPADWTSLTSGERFLYADGDLAAQAAASSGYFEMDIAGLYEIVIEGSAAVGAASVTPYWSLH